MIKDLFKTIFILISLCFFQSVKSQSDFKILENNNTQVKFNLINNLIVIPLEINGVTLSFILDTGVNKTILFNLSRQDSLGLLNTKTVALRGLGDGASVGAMISKKNTITINNIVSNNQTIYVILDDFFSLSNKMGTTIHGIIGYNLFKNFIVKINYKTKKLEFYNPNTFVYPKCSKCGTLPIKFYRKKPYINAKVQLDTLVGKMTKVKMLVDTGGSDALWLFENSKKEIKTPKRFFKDILGEGLSGAIYGNRSRIRKFEIAGFNIINPTISFLDSASTHNARKFRQRNGSVGGGILRRFKVWIDYPNKKITLKKNGSLSKEFHYNMSGIDVIYNGKQLIKEEILNRFKSTENREGETFNSVFFVKQYSFKFKPSYKINKIIKNSAAHKAGLLEGDILLRINGKAAYELKMSDILNLFQERDKKKIKITVERYGIKRDFKFRLEKRI